MHLAFHQLRVLVPLVLCIGVFPNLLNAEVEEPDMDALAQKKLVYVEPTNVSDTKVDGEYPLIPYLERRHKWGWLFSLGYSAYEPTNYNPNFAPPSFSYRRVYDSPTSPLLELSMTFKRNMPIGSVGLNFTPGFFRNEHSDPRVIGSSLMLIPIQIGGVFSMDTLSKDPFIVPYAGAGGYVMVYEESLHGKAVHGNSTIAPYVHGGVEFGLDWIDRHAARVAYDHSGIETSFIYVEVKKYFSSSNKKDFDFSNDANWAAGIRIEM